MERPIFNLIEIFRTTRKSVTEEVVSGSHCEEKYHHDFYCDQEKPFVENL